MENEGITKYLLEKLYRAYFQEGEAVNLNEVCQELGVENTRFWNIVHRLTEEGLLKAYAMGGYFVIQPFGVIQAEEMNIAPESVKEENQRLRTLLLERLAIIYEKQGVYADEHIETLAKEIDADSRLLYLNLRVLRDLGYVEPVAIGTYKITLRGLEVVQQWRERIRLVNEFEALSDLSPQARGRGLQKLLAKILEREGWLQEEGTRASHEEMDVIIHKGREYYLIECKWEKEPIQAGVVRELYGKLSNRVGVQGILVSMSGFTQGAVKQAEDYASNRIILLFGKRDFQRLVYSEATFEDLLNKKYQELITRRRAIYS